MSDPKEIKSLLDFVEAIGVTFQMDWDGEVIIEAGDVDQRVMVHAVKRAGLELQKQYRLRAEINRRCCVGGPLNGEPVAWNWNRWNPCLHHVSRGKWVVYRCESDGRAFFVGETSSQDKALGMWREATKGTTNV